MKYIITCIFNDAPPEVYHDTLPALDRNIAVTWSKIPHKVQKTFDTWIVDGAEGTLAMFKLQVVPSIQELPGHF